VTLPDGLLRHSKSLELQWVDAYRG
jgi:hypothetical protein